MGSITPGPAKAPPFKQALTERGPTCPGMIGLVEFGFVGVAATTLIVVALRNDPRVLRGPRDRAILLILSVGLLAVAVAGIWFTQ